MNYYEILNLTRDCSIDDIKNNYRQLCKIHHPDKNGGDDTMFRKIREAYETLTNEDKKSNYDFELDNGDGCIPKNINIKHILNVSLKDCYFGCDRSIKINGHIHTFHIPQYTKSGDSILVKGEGWNGGDLELEVVIPKEDDMWMDEKYNIHILKYIDIWDGLLGCKVKVDFFGEEYECNIRPTLNESITAILGKGYPIGDKKSILIVEVKVRPPKNLNEQQIELIKKIKELNGES